MAKNILIYYRNFAIRVDQQAESRPFGTISRKIPGFFTVRPRCRAWAALRTGAVCRAQGGASSGHRLLSGDRLPLSGLPFPPIAPALPPCSVSTSASNFASRKQGPPPFSRLPSSHSASCFGAPFLTLCLLILLAFSWTGRGRPPSPSIPSHSASNFSSDKQGAFPPSLPPSLPLAPSFRKSVVTT